MKVTLERTSSTDQGTFGVLKAGGLTLHTLELPWRNNRQQKSCIPVGTYRCAVVRSPKFGHVYGVLDVPGRSNVLIHPANFAGDTEQNWETQLHGCIAPCTRIGVMRNKNGVMQAAGLISRPAVEKLNALLKGEPFTLEIT